MTHPSRFLLGAWKLVVLEWREAGGKITYPMGRRAKGYLIYDASGFMSATIMASGRRKFGRRAGILDGTAAERAAAARTYVSYAGSFTVNGRIVRHHVEVCLFPNWVGTTLRRRIESTGRRLILTTESFLLKGNKCVARLVWERA